MVVIVFGLPGSGKSYFASRLAKKLEADYISSDQVRKKLFTRPDYSEEGKKQVYKKLFDLMYDQARSRKSLVIDGTFTGRISEVILKSWQMTCMLIFAGLRSRQKSRSYKNE